MNYISIRRTANDKNETDKKPHQIFFLLKLRAVMLYILQGQTVKADPTFKAAEITNQYYHFQKKSLSTITIKLLCALKSLACRGAQAPTLFVSECGGSERPC